MNKLTRTATGIISFLVFYAASKYFGTITIVLPAICIVITFWLTKKYMPDFSKPMLPAVAFIGGHCLWFIIGTISLLTVTEVPQDLLINYKSSLIDAGVMVALFLWLLLRPGFVSGLVNLIFSSIEVIFTIVILSEPNNELMNKAYLLHLVVYVLTVVALIYGLYKLRNNSLASNQTLFGPPNP